ncbi:hypothetical protein L596_005185 [Steinernema carpocapsae]|uniref:Cell cycle control protein 50A n=1 Tax=Steinernema carpocapsae TaxID=34508 RepID=A0A4U8UZN8_STECR|nr:hypothetical protein L596_005185 [Steinernema carpocapsae]
MPGSANSSVLGASPAPGSSAMNGIGGEKAKKNKPKASRLRQQKLPAWQPILNATTVIPLIFGVGIVFLPLGVVLFMASNGVTEYDFVYSTDQPINVDHNILRGNTDFNQRKMRIPLPQGLEGDVYFYYRLENYFQNHRRYLKSRSDKQLIGNLKTVDECAPYDKLKDELTNTEQVIAPCGAIANSLFNDTFKLLYNDITPVPFTTKGVVWDIDKDTKFKNPPGPDLKTAFEGTHKPINWLWPVWRLDLNDTENNGFQNVDLIVWMRTAALPDFRKLYRLLDKTPNKDPYKLFTNGLPKGNYTLVINDNYPVSAFGGRKHFIISTTSWAGGKNAFLGITYMVVGSLCIVLGLVFLIVHRNFGSSLHDLANIKDSAT